MAARRGGRRRPFGSVRKLPSGRFQARYVGPDGEHYKGHVTFETKGAADVYLSTVRADIEREEWVEPGKAKAAEVVLTLTIYAGSWLNGRTLKPRTKAHYQDLLDRHILPTLGGHELTALTPAIVRAWHEGLETGDTAKAHAYSLLRTIMGTAVDDELLATNPCRIRGAGQTKRQIKIKPASTAELRAIVAAMPDHYGAMVLLAAWCALRFGELVALTRGDVDMTKGVVHVRSGVVRVNGAAQLSTPKSAAGVRDVHVPASLLPVLEAHLREHVGPGKAALLFPAKAGGFLAPSAFYGRAATLDKDGTVKRSGWGWYEARRQAGREDLRFHDLRHTGAVMAAQTGATLAELQARLGHATVGAAMRYQHAADDRDAVIAIKLSALMDEGE